MTQTEENTPIYKRKWVVISLLAVGLVMLGDTVFVLATHGRSGAVNIVPLAHAPAPTAAGQITVLTVNMAHGRGDGRHQLLQFKSVIEANVDDVGHLIARENAHVVALQEADAPSWWSGGYSHVDRLGRLGGMTSAIQGLNVDGLGLHYGAALVTRLSVSKARQVTFETSVPTLSKGMVVVTCAWPGDPDYKFDVVSLHLDFASAAVRANQLSVMAEQLRASPRPIIMMGDFNTDMSSPALPDFLELTGLRAWGPGDQSIVTFPSLGTHIDWILVSPELEIVTQRVLGDVLSDHRFVRATIERRGDRD